MYGAYILLKNMRKKAKKFFKKNSWIGRKFKKLINFYGQLIPKNIPILL